MDLQSMNILVKYEKLTLYEIMVPTRVNNRRVTLDFHHQWDDKVRAISGGLTVFRGAVGQWIAPDGTLYRERMIPVRIACSDTDIQKIADITAKHYQQKAVMYYVVSKEAYIKYYE